MRLCVDAPWTVPYKTPDFLTWDPPLSTFALDKVSARLPNAAAERYTDRAVSALLVWTDVPDFMEIPAPALEAALDRVTAE